MSDLLVREPLGLILEQTLSTYWSEISGDAVEVFWGDNKKGGQAWLGNSYLNFFCTQDVSPVCFENIVKEFSHARVWWRRGLQAAYVRAAIAPPLREWFSQVRFCVTKEIVEASQQLLIGGRNRFRIIQPQAGESIVIAKTGFPRLSFEREVAARQDCASEVAPRFLGMRANGMAFAEEYYVGMPANRLPTPLAIRARTDATRRLIESVHQPKLRVDTLVNYFERLDLIVADYSIIAAEQARKLTDWVARHCGSAAIGLTLTHGDFQNANILVSGQELRIIDWETATERSQLYDLATLSADIRLATDRFDTWRKTVTLWLDELRQAPQLLVPIDGRDSLLGHAAVWWMEEMIFQLEEARAGYSADTDACDRVVTANLSRACQFLQSVSG